MKINQYFITNVTSISLDTVDFSVNVIDSYKIFNHNNLKANSFKYNGNELIILGDIFNPFEPESTIGNIGDELIKSESLDSVLKQIDKLTGRFVLFVKINKTFHLLSDFFCQRQVYYWFNEDNFYASSSQKLVLDVLNLDLSVDNEKLKLSKSNYFLKIHEHWLLGETDWDNRLKKLLPNHRLVIQQKTLKRIPVYASKIPNRDGLVKEVLSILKNSIKAYSVRYSLMLGLTSGYDSRLLMSSSITLNKIIKYFTFSRKGAYIQKDVSIAKHLSEIYNLDYEEVLTKDLSTEFETEFRKQFLIPRLLDKTKNIQWFKNQNLESTAVVSGNGGALIRSIYDEDDFKNSISICKAIEYEPNNLNIRLLDSWLHSAKKYASENGLLVSDLFYLEVRLGKWGSKMVHELDFSGVEEFSPYNNRHLMYSILLNYNKDERKTITVNLLEQSLDGITALPFNPKTWKDAVKKIIFYEHYKKFIQKNK